MSITNLVADPLSDFDRLPENREPFLTELGIEPRSPTLEFAGWITKQVSLDVLLDAFQEVVLRRYPMASRPTRGDGQEKAQQKAPARLGLSDRMIWAGYPWDMARRRAAIEIDVQASVQWSSPPTPVEGGEPTMTRQ